MASDETTDVKLTAGPTLSDQAHGTIRQMIVDGRLSAGEKITERSLGEMLGVSPTPIREAFRRLEQERLIERRDGRNLTVAAPSSDDLRKLNLIQAALRGVAARLAAESATEDELAAIQVAQRKSQDPDRRSKVSPTARIATTRGLHEMIDRAAHSPLLRDMIATTTAFDLAERVQVAEALRDRYPTTGIGEHAEIVEALVARDGEKAERLMRAHLIRTGEFLLEQRKSSITGSTPGEDRTP